jgi:LPXTG-motif cell wall-anchored protein
MVGLPPFLPQFLSDEVFARYCLITNENALPFLRGWSNKVLGDGCVMRHPQTGEIRSWIEIIILLVMILLVMILSSLRKRKSP